MSLEQLAMPESKEVLRKQNSKRTCPRSGCHNEPSQTGRLKQQKFHSHSSGGWQVQDQSASQGDFIPRPLLLVMQAAIISLCARMTFVGMPGDMEMLPRVSLYKGTNPIIRGLSGTQLHLSTAQMPVFKYQHVWDWVSTYEAGKGRRHKHSVQNSVSKGYRSQMKDPLIPKEPKAMSGKINSVVLNYNPKYKRNTHESMWIQIIE